MARLRRAISGDCVVFLDVVVVEAAHRDKEHPATDTHQLIGGDDFRDRLGLRGEASCFSSRA